VATIEERSTHGGKAHYRVTVRKKGAAPQRATFKTKTAAKRWATNIESAIDEARHFNSSEAKRRTVAELIDRYIAEVLPRKSEVQQPRQRVQLEWWKEQIGHLTLAGVTPAVIAEARDLLAGEGEDSERRRSPATVNRYLAALSHAFTVAVREWGWMDSSPARKVTRFTEPAGRVRFLSDDERDRLLKACQGSAEPLLYPVVVLALSTGARRSEILSLRWPQVDLKRHAIRLEKTKNRERRSLPLAGHALRLLSELAKVRRIDTDLVFPDRRSEGPARLNGPWDKAVKEARLEDFRFHDLRHSAASYLAMNGATLTEIADILGHKTLQMVKRYAHLTEQHTARVVEAMNKRIFRG
jgi:integrase